MPAVREGAKGLKRHGDYAIALALAWFASSGKFVEYDYRAAGRADAANNDHWLGDPSGQGAGWWRRPLGAGFRGAL